jgi:hypothetical protein
MARRIESGGWDVVVGWILLMAWSLRLVEPKRFDAGGFSEGKGNLLTVCAIEYLTMDRSDMDLSPAWMSNEGPSRLAFGEEPQVSGYIACQSSIPYPHFTTSPLFGPICYILFRELFEGRYGRHHIHLQVGRLK